jgi:hypothetical protein
MLLLCITALLMPICSRGGSTLLHPATPRETAGAGLARQPSCQSHCLYPAKREGGVPPVVASAFDAHALRSSPKSSD